MLLVGMTGFGSMTLVAMYNVALALTYGPSTLYTAPLAACGGSLGRVGPVALLLLLVNALHAGAYFYMLDSIGAVSAGIMKVVPASVRC